MDKRLNILGIRGIPANHGGFETFAERLALYLTSKGWDVLVYCQVVDGENHADSWNGISRINIKSGESSLGTVVFDAKCVIDSISRPGVDLFLGYNTAIFTVISRLFRRNILMNMDGIEWQRDKWPYLVKMWFYFNEFVGYRLATTPIADHPEIARHLLRHGKRKTAIIPYGSDAIENGDIELIHAMDFPRICILPVSRVPSQKILF